MKKSTMLKSVRIVVSGDSEYRFICNILTRFYVEPSFAHFPTDKVLQTATNARQLVDWINSYLGNDFSVRCTGVEAWLRNNGYAQEFYLRDEMLEYRKLWLDNMIAYWKARGD